MGKGDDGGGIRVLNEPPNAGLGCGRDYRDYNAASKPGALSLYDLILCTPTLPNTPPLPNNPLVPYQSTIAKQSAIAKYFAVANQSANDPPHHHHFHILQKHTAIKTSIEEPLVQLQESTDIVGQQTVPWMQRCARQHSSNSLWAV